MTNAPIQILRWVPLNSDFSLLWSGGRGRRTSPLENEKIKKNTHILDPQMIEM